MRVMVLHNRYRQPGGEDAVVRREVAMLRAHGVDVLEHEVDNEVEHQVVGNVALLAHSAWSRDSHATVRRMCEEFRPAVVHVHNFWMRLTPSVHAAAHQAGAATVQTLHNYRLICANGCLLRNDKVCEDCVGTTPWRGVVHRCYHDSLVASAAAARFIMHNRRRATWTRDVDAFITPSESARRKLQHASLPEDRVFVKPNFTEDPGPVGSSPSDSRTFVFAGRLSPEKGVHWLISAWAEVMRSAPQGAQLIIAGDGPERAALVKQAQPLTSVSFAGQVRSDDLIKLIQRARAVVMPSLNLETFGVAIVEGFACGRPAIVSDQGGQAELVQGGWNGWKVPPLDGVELARALGAVLADDRLADRLGRNARSHFLEHYTPEVNFHMLSGIYDFAIRHRQVTQAFEPVLMGAGSPAKGDENRVGQAVSPAPIVGTGRRNRLPHSARARFFESMWSLDRDRLSATQARMRLRTIVPVPPKTSVLGIGVSAVNYGQILRLVRKWIDEKQRGRYVAILTVHSVMTGFFDPGYRAILNRAALATSDGMPLVWALRSFGVTGQRRVYGPDLMIALCGQAQRLGHRIFLYGGREETLPVLCSRLHQRLPGLQIAGVHSPPFRPLTPDEDAQCVERIRASRADIVFCGIGVPKQERWMAEHASRLPGCVLFGVGAAFDFHAGRVKQAPAWMRRSGLEWLFRMLMEPRRLWRRYVFLNPMFLVLWAMQLAGLLHTGGTYAEER